MNILGVGRRYPVYYIYLGQIDGRVETMNILSLKHYADWPDDKNAIVKKNKLLA